MEEKDKQNKKKLFIACPRFKDQRKSTQLKDACVSINTSLTYTYVCEHYIQNHQVEGRVI